MDEFYEGIRAGCDGDVRDEARRRRDERLLADWEQVQRDAQGDPWALLAFVESLRNFRYWVARDKADAEARRAQAKRFRRQRALEEGAQLIITTGRALAAERVRASMSQRQLARAASIPHDILAKIERDTRRLFFHEACRLADALGVPLDRFRSA